MHNMLKSLIVLFLLVTISACGPSAIYTSKGDAVVGQDGLNSLVELAPSAACANSGVTLLSGLDVDRDGVLALTEVKASSEVCNGLDGQNGSNGQNGANGQDAAPTAFTPVAVLNPCGDAPSVYDEVFIKLQNGTVLASMSDKVNGENTRFVIVPTAVRLRTTDGDQCDFEIGTTGDFTYQSK